MEIPMVASNGSAKADQKLGGHTAFFYGTLMAPEVFYTVCYGTKDAPPAVVERHAFHPAVLHGYCRRRVRYADYPGIVADAGHVVRGAFVTGLTDENMKGLDYFEGSEYERRRVRVRLLSRVGDDRGEGNVEGEEHTAEVYVFKDGSHLEVGEWDFEQFRRDKLHLWTRAGFVFEDCDPENPATVAQSDIPEEAQGSAV